MSFRAILISAALIVALGATEPVSAHPAGATVARAMSVPIAESPPPATPSLETGSRDSGATATLVLILMILGGLCLVVGRQHASRAVALSLLLIVSGFEGALHSVHHLDDTTAQCRVASSAEHVSVVAIAAPRIRAPSIVTIEGTSLGGHTPVRSAELTPAASRAPPV